MCGAKERQRLQWGGWLFRSLSVGSGYYGVHIWSVGLPPLDLLSQCPFCSFVLGEPYPVRGGYLFWQHAFLPLFLPWLIIPLYCTLYVHTYDPWQILKTEWTTSLFAKGKNPNLISVSTLISCKKQNQTCFWRIDKNLTPSSTYLIQCFPCCGSSSLEIHETPRMGGPLLVIVQICQCLHVINFEVVWFHKINYSCFHIWRLRKKLHLNIDVKLFSISMSNLRFKSKK